MKNIIAFSLMLLPMADLSAETVVDYNAANVEGTDGRDILVGGDGDTSFDGGAGDDLIDPGYGCDDVVGREGNDTIYVRSEIRPDGSLGDLCGWSYSDGMAGNDTYIMVVEDLLGLAMSIGGFSQGNIQMIKLKPGDVAVLEGTGGEPLSNLVVDPDPTDANGDGQAEQRLVLYLGFPLFAIDDAATAPLSVTSHFGELAVVPW